MAKIQWTLMSKFEWRNLRLLREPVLWFTFIIPQVSLIVANVFRGSLGWEDAAIAAVNFFLSVLTREQVSAPVAPADSEYGTAHPTPLGVIWGHDDSYGEGE